MSSARGFTVGPQSMVDSPQCIAHSPQSADHRLLFGGFVGGEKAQRQEPDANNRGPSTVDREQTKKPNPSFLRARGLVKEFKSHAGAVRVLEGIDLAVENGEAIAITGPSGSGKTTLLHCLGALMQPTSGTLSLDGRDPWQLSDRQRSRLRATEIGFVFQSYHLLPNLSVFENCLLAVRIAAKKPEPLRIKNVLKRLGLERDINKYPAELSGGQAQRTGLARALVTEPRFLLCDEPTGNLDPASTRRILEILTDIKKEGKQSLIIVTHNTDVARIADRILVLEAGRITT